MTTPDAGTGNELRELRERVECALAPSGAEAVASVWPIIEAAVTEAEERALTQAAAVAENLEDPLGMFPVNWCSGPWNMLAAAWLRARAAGGPK